MYRETIIVILKFMPARPNIPVLQAKQCKPREECKKEKTEHRISNLVEKQLGKNSNLCGNLYTEVSFVFFLSQTTGIKPFATATN